MKSEVISFAEKYINFFHNKFGTTPQSYYQFFDSDTFPNDCRKLGYEMDCGKSFIAAYGEEAWDKYDNLARIIDKATDVKIIGSGLFSKWRYFNHWSYSHATEEDKKWFLLLFERMIALDK